MADLLQAAGFAVAEFRADRGHGLAGDAVQAVGRGGGGAGRVRHAQAVAGFVVGPGAALLEAVGLLSPSRMRFVPCCPPLQT